MRTIVVLFSLVLWSGIAAAQDNPSKTEDALYRASQAALVGGLVLDLWTTVKAINGPPIHVSYLYCQDGSQTCQFPMFVETTFSFREVGPASWFGIQKPGSIVAAGAAFDAGILTASHFLYKKGGIWRKVAIGINFVLGGSHLGAGFGNIDKMKSSKLGLVPAGAFSIRW
ncbi:MAG: hypothetical protein HYT67_01630 [Candidatus Yanofskybacteria bacterium]|nr:hypothetical protein [Candidatus Yanofskybacteria bacterium]